MRSLTRAFLVWALVILGVVLPATALAEGYPYPAYRYFSETGHSVKGAFLEFFEDHGGENIFGYPRTEEFIEDDIRVQYFQRVRFEWHPENEDPYKVQLSLLGEMLGPSVPRIPTHQIPPPYLKTKRYYSETGHTISYDFLEYFDAHGGVDVFGYPITELIIEDGRMMQYFQRARFEWNDDPLEPEVQLAPLGDIYIDEFGVAPALLEAVAPTGMVLSRPTPSPSPWVHHVNGRVQFTVTGSGGNQTVYITVTDRNGTGIAGATVRLEVYYPSGTREYLMPLTDTRGDTTYSFPIGHPAPGITVLMNASAAHLGKIASTQLSFKVWW